MDGSSNLIELHCILNKDEPTFHKLFPRTLRKAAFSVSVPSHCLSPWQYPSRDLIAKSLVVLTFPIRKQFQVPSPIIFSIVLQNPLKILFVRKGCASCNRRFKCTNFSRQFTTEELTKPCCTWLAFMECTTQVLFTSSLRIKQSREH